MKYFSFCIKYFLFKDMYSLSKYFFTQYDLLCMPRQVLTWVAFLCLVRPYRCHSGCPSTSSPLQPCSTSKWSVLEFSSASWTNQR